MRSPALTLLTLVLAQSALRADPPARLGLPLGGDAPPPALGAPRSTPSLLPDAVPPPLGSPGAAMQPGYPLSFPGLPGAGGPSGTKTPPRSLPAGALIAPDAPGPGGERPGLAPPPYATGPCGPINDAIRPRELSRDPFAENLSFFFGLDGAHEPLDLGLNARFGYRAHLHWGLPLVEDWNLGLHLGLGYNFGYNAVRVLSPITGSNADHQTFFTVGVFQRDKLAFNWELAWDFRNDDYYEQFSTSQWRGLVSRTLGTEEVGVWGTLRDRTDRGHVGATWFNVRSINQINLFWKHTWDNQIVTGLHLGMADEHGRFSLINTREGAIQHPFLFGADLFVPLSDRLALFGEATFLTPNDTGTVIATLGLAWYPAGRPADQPRGLFSPLLPTANNASMPLDVQR